jgi:hypothetical protein
MTFDPTPEQRAALDLFASGETMVIEAGAGTGKTSTLRLLAHSTEKRGQYLAYNKAIVTDVSGSLPETCAARTAHSLAFAAVGKKFAHRLNSPRMRSDEIARRLGIGPFTLRYGTQTKVLQPGFLAGLAMRSVAVFCSTADREPTKRHVPYQDGLDVPTNAGVRTYRNNDALAEMLVPAMRIAWFDLMNPGGDLPYRHDHYLKAWQLADPRIPVDYVLFDEAQDASPVMAAIVASQDHAQKVYVGDSAQAIYEWRGAVNALAGFDADDRRCLTQSFRFGPAIADRANEILAELDAPLRLTGLDSIPSQIGKISGDPDALLCRSNAGAVAAVLDAQRRSVRAHLVGGGNEVLSFAKAAQDLMDGGRSYHPELACFDSWGEVKDYVSQDAQGGELRLLVSLVEEFGVPTIRRALEHMPREDASDLVVSTAHKAKGREWDRVKIAADFVTPKMKALEELGGETDASEMRLRYVAVTRAKLLLDCSALDSSEVEEPAA